MDKANWLDDLCLQADWARRAQAQEVAENQPQPKPVPKKKVVPQEDGPVIKQEELDVKL